MLAALLNISKNSFDYWSGHNNAEHENIYNAIYAQFGQNLTKWVLFPVPTDDFEGWLQRHQDIHTEMDAVLGIAGGDLTTLDFKDPSQVESWKLQHFAEHVQASSILGLK